LLNRVNLRKDEMPRGFDRSGGRRGGKAEVKWAPAHRPGKGTLRGLEEDWGRSYEKTPRQKGRTEPCRGNQDILALRDTIQRVHFNWHEEDSKPLRKRGTGDHPGRQASWGEEKEHVGSD